MLFGGSVLVWGDTGWYLVVLDEHNLVLFGIKWYWFSKGLLSLYVLKIVEIWSGDTKAGRMNEQTRRDRANGPWKSEMSKKEIDNTHTWTLEHLIQFNTVLPLNTLLDHRFVIPQVGQVKF